MRVLNFSKIYYLIDIKSLQLLGSYSRLAVEIKHELTELLRGGEPECRYELQCFHKYFQTQTGGCNRKDLGQILGMLVLSQGPHAE